jgi:peptidyl-prolyl cis-trans isomerase A (cyclophilin A)
VTRALVVLALALLVSTSPACGPSPAPSEPAPPSPIVQIEGDPRPIVAVEPEPAPPLEAPPSGALYDPAKATLRAPSTFRARFETTKGAFVVEATRASAPHGVDRLYSLVAIGYFTDIALYRVVSGFVVQFGIHGDPAVNAVWKEATLPPDDVVGSNVRGTLSFAQAGSPDSRNVQLFVNLVDNARLDSMGFAPVGRVIEGMQVVEAFFAGYADQISREQPRIQAEGNAFLRKDFPELEYVIRAAIVGS